MEEIKQIIVSVSDQLFGIDIDDVVEIKENCDITMMPSSKSNVLGIMNLRNDYIPVYSFRKKIGKEEKLDIDNKVVVVSVNNINIGIKIDAVKEIANIDNENVFPLPRIAKGHNTKYIRRVANINKDLVLLLNLDAIVSMEDLDHIDRIMSNVQ